MWNVLPHFNAASISKPTLAASVSLAYPRLAALCAPLLLACVSVVAQAEPAKSVAVPCGDTELNKGLVVESVAKYSEGEKAGLVEGDVILSWTRGSANGSIESPFDLLEVEAEQEPLGRVALQGGTKAWTLGPDKWGIQARPNFTGNLLTAYHEGQELAKAGKFNEAIAAWRRAAQDSGSSRCSWSAPWLLFHAAQTFADKQQWKEADPLYQEAIGKTQPADIRTTVQLQLAWADSFQRRGDGSSAEKLYQLTLNNARKLGPDNRGIDASLLGLGAVALYRGDLDNAESYFQQTLEIRERVAPGSLGVAKSLNGLGIVAAQRGDLAKEEHYFFQVLEIEKRLAPDGLEVAATLNNLGNAARDHADLAKAEEYYHQALTIREKLDPGGLNVAMILNNLGNIALDRGNLAQSEDYDREALEIKEKLAPGSLYVAASLNNLGQVARARGDLAKAEDYYRAGLEIREKLAPGSLHVATSLNNLGEVARARGDLARAEEYFRQALAIREKLAPGSLDVAWNLSSLGDLARERRDLAEASKYYGQALEIRKKLAPASAGCAETLAALAGILRDQQQPEEAARLYAQAIDVLESQVAHLGGSNDVRTGFRATHADVYSAYVDLLLTQKQPELAFQVVERSRARTLLEMLTDARVDIRQGADPSLMARERELQVTLTAKSNRKIRLLEGKHTEEQVAAINKEIDDYLRQYQEVEGQIRTSSPNYAALTQPQPLSARDVQRQLLDKDTVLLEYVLGEKRSYVFLLTPNSLDSYELPKRSEIEGAARHVYDVLTTRNRWIEGETSARREQRLAKRNVEYQWAVSALSQMILGPVATRLQGKRLLIVADGMLQYVPFAVLPAPAENQSKPAVALVVEHEIVNLPSASVLAVLRRQANGRRTPPKEVAVLADPVFDKYDSRVSQARQVTPAIVFASEKKPSAPLPDQLTRSLGDVGINTRGTNFALPRLTFSRQEADTIVATATAGKRMEALDFKASRDTALSKGLGDYRIVHFATHGVLDNEHPELSGLVLSLVDAEGRPRDGFLDLEDVYNLTLPADLVVASACETGLGKQITGEGLVGLTRGFMYAGATRVVASLWNVDDVATAELMGRFYRGMLKEGLRPAAALRQAQMEMQKQKRWADPYYWAAFAIQGEWK